ncbi:hypothetical protein TanjilG_21642 [Lupinus angustifolius]|uniref:DUF1685 family protein n=1 Tax=Lupinus angustifolius TaxID=3871 RepID=A0A4P1QV17_LUPAN|nr:PREDICTED: uncharacterized protein LOC109330122 [Lupinus angustifolius]OIV95252.1 hypothetical protein TanjilG_21642 [Lupinus angustifolius]
MEAEAILNLFDYYWFGLKNLNEHPSSSASTNSHENSDHINIEEPFEPRLSTIQTNHTRSMSDQLNSMTCFNDHDFFSPKLQTILSGKDVTNIVDEKHAKVQLEVLLPKKKNIAIKGRKKRENKSLSDLEFEELKGFMDLGFVFSEEDKDSSLVSIIPGLQRFGKNGEVEEEDCDVSEISRPYLSEAWKVQERRMKENPLRNWKVPVLNNENDMKHSLRLWAHTVASTVK